MNEQERFWAGDFGRDYTARNRVNWRSRVSFWDLILEKTGARSALEVGCNAGWNLMALRAVDPTLKLRGVDVNEEAVREAKAEFLDARIVPGAQVGGLWPGRFGLTFTAGVLIHVAPEDLESTMRSLVAASNRHVLAVEYAAASEEHVEYRGHAEKLWKRPYGQLYEELGLEMEAVGELGAGDGFGEGCTYWLMRKPEAVC